MSDVTVVPTSPPGYSSSQLSPWHHGVVDVDFTWPDVREATAAVAQPLGQAITRNGLRSAIRQSVPALVAVADHLQHHVFHGHVLLCSHRFVQSPPDPMSQKLSMLTTNSGLGLLTQVGEGSSRYPWALALEAKTTKATAEESAIPHSIVVTRSGSW
jgi:hypothetical protein